MTRWTIEKSGTGIEKSGTGIEKSGTGIEKSGTGIEKSGTGIEKSGTGLRKSLLALSLSAIAFSSQVSAENLRPKGSLNVVAQNNSILVSWIIDGSVFSGVASLNGSSTLVSLTEVALADRGQAKERGTGSKVNTTGGGTGSSLETTGGGTGLQTTGGGTGLQTTGGGTGLQTTGGGTGLQTTGGGTGLQTTGGGTGGSIVLTTGGGTGQESVAITLPNNTGMEMEIILDCQTATVSVLDFNYTEVASFNNIKVMGDTGLCHSNNDDEFDVWIEENTYR